MFAYYDDSKIIGYYSLSLQENDEYGLNNLCVLLQYRHKHIGTKKFDFFPFTCGYMKRDLI